MTRDWKQFEGQIVAGTFVLRRWLGGSAAGATYQTELGEVSPQHAAIKLIPAGEHADVQLATWEMAAGLAHPHLLRVLNSGRCRLGGDEMLYIVTEHAEENLAEVLPARPLSIDEARQMLPPVVAALGYLHGRGLVHSRIKPANILALEDVVKLSADSLAPAGEPREAGAAPGSYDAPEVLAGEGVTPAADLWSLGMTLVEALTQQLPQWAPESLDDPEPPLSLPAPFADVVRGCLHRDAQRRWTVAELSAWLGKAAPVPAPAREPQGEPRPPSRAAESAPKPSPEPATRGGATGTWRHVLPAAGIILVVVAVIAGSALLNRSDGDEPAEENAVEQPQRPATAQPRVTPAATSPAAAAPAPPPKSSAGQAVAGDVTRRVMPDVSQTALDTIRGTVVVSVRVSVDAAGRVTLASFETPGPSRYFADRSLDAARRWEFRAPVTAGQPVRSEWLLRFTFTQTGASASASQATP